MPQCKILTGITHSTLLTLQIRIGFGPLATLPNSESHGSTGISHFNWNLRSLAVLGLQSV